MKKILSLLFIGLMSASLSTFAMDGIQKKVLANFNAKILVIPCVKVEGSDFNGYYNVVMEVSGDESGLNWEVIQVTVADPDECEPEVSEDVSLDQLLNSLGMPPLSELIDPSRYHDYENSQDEDDDQDQNDDSQDDSDDDNSGTGESEGEIVVE